MPTDPEMPSYPQIPTRPYILVILLLTASFAAGAMGQNQPPKAAENPPAPVFPSAAPASGQPATDQAETSQTADEGGGAPRLGMGDLVEVDVYGVPELSTKSRLGNTGDVYLPLVDYVHLAGLTVEEAQALIEKRLSDGGFVKSPHVTLNVDQSTSQGASLLGEVSKPGVYPIIGEPRLFDVISAAGGFTAMAGQSITVTHRNQSDKPVTVPLKRKLSDDPASNIAVLPGDTILVHKADVVYAVGEVGRPSGFLMDSDNLTVMKVVALAGGTTKNAKMNGVRIIRKGPDGMMEIPIELKKMLEAKVLDVPMKADDILFVPSSAVKIALSRTVDVAVQAASAATIVALQ
jgi:polysaccharide biosynthesis/export protein